MSEMNNLEKKKKRKTTDSEALLQSLVNNVITAIPFFILVGGAF
jgi:hypothetical protein